MTFGYECRPSFWRTVRANSHLVIAGLGTASFLGVAGLALWLAIPDADRQAFADSDPETVVHQVVAEAPVVSEPAAPAPAEAAPHSEPPAKQTAAESELPALKPSDTRWKDPNASGTPPAPSAEQAVSAEASGAQPLAADPAGAAVSSAISAFAAENRAQLNNDPGSAGNKPDDSETAAIPAAKPLPKAGEGKTAGEDSTATQPGRTARAVTMRTGPRKGAAAMGTLPANTAVEVVDCKQWCEIVYNGKRGFIYKSYLDRD